MQTYPLIFKGQYPLPSGIYVTPVGKLGAFIEVKFMFASSTGPEAIQQGDSIIKTPNGELHVQPKLSVQTSS